MSALKKLEPAHKPNQDAIDAVCEAINAANKALRLAADTDSHKRRAVLVGIAAPDEGSMLDLALMHLRNV